MPKLSPERQQERREHFVAAALRCFVRNGLAATSMAEIIKESGLSAGSAYSHFSSKDALVHAVARHVLETGLDRIAASADGAPFTPQRAFDEATRVLRPEFARVVVDVWGEIAHNPVMADLGRQNIADVRRSLCAALTVPTRHGPSAAADDPLVQSAADAVIAITHGYIVRLALDPDVDPEQLRTQLRKALASDDGRA